MPNAMLDCVACFPVTSKATRSASERLPSISTNTSCASRTERQKRRTRPVAATVNGSSRGPNSGSGHRSTPTCVLRRADLARLRRRSGFGVSNSEPGTHRDGEPPDGERRKLVEVAKVDAVPRPPGPGGREVPPVRGAVEHEDVAAVEVEYVHRPRRAVLVQVDAAPVLAGAEVRSHTWCPSWNFSIASGERRRRRGSLAFLALPSARRRDGAARGERREGSSSLRSWFLAPRRRRRWPMASAANLRASVPEAVAASRR